MTATDLRGLTPFLLPTSSAPRAALGMHLPPQWSLKHQPSLLTRMRRVTLVVSDGAGIVRAGMICVTRIVADGAGIVRTGEAPNTGAVPHGTSVESAGKIPVAGVILDITCVLRAGDRPHTGVLPDVRHHHRWEQHQLQHHSSHKDTGSRVCLPHGRASFCGVKSTGLGCARSKRPPVGTALSFILLSRFMLRGGWCQVLFGSYPKSVTASGARRSSGRYWRRTSTSSDTRTRDG